MSSTATSHDLDSLWAGIAIPKRPLHCSGTDASNQEQVREIACSLLSGSLVGEPDVVTPKPADLLSAESETVLRWSSARDVVPDLET